MASCPAILASGDRNGQICDRTPIVNRTYCWYHRRQELNTNHEIKNNLVVGDHQVNNHVIVDDHHQAGYIQVTCVICHEIVTMDNLFSIVPCGHTCLCYDCVKHFGPTQRFKSCPVCQRLIAKITKLFYPTLIQNEIGNPIQNEIGQPHNRPRRTLYQKIKLLFCRV